MGLLFGSGALDAELGARKEPFGISVYFGRPSPRGLLALILALFIAQVVACAAGVRALMGGRGGHAAGRLSLRTGAGALFFTGLAQTGLLSDSSARRRAVWSLDTVGACLVPNAASGGQQLYTCRRLASATLESEGDGAPSADCLEGRRSWLACFDGSFLCLCFLPERKRIVFSTALICTTRRRILAIAGTNQGPEKGGLNHAGGRCAVCGLSGRAAVVAGVLRRIFPVPGQERSGPGLQGYLAVSGTAGGATGGAHDR